MTDADETTDNKKGEVRPSPGRDSKLEDKIADEKDEELLKHDDRDGFSSASRFSFFAALDCQGKSLISIPSASQIGGNLRAVLFIGNETIWPRRSPSIEVIGEETNVWQRHRLDFCNQPYRPSVYVVGAIDHHLSAKGSLLKPTVSQASQRYHSKTTLSPG